VFQNSFDYARMLPQGLKPGIFAGLNGTAKAVPFQSLFLSAMLSQTLNSLRRDRFAFDF
jgi:hypothetical protein